MIRVPALLACILFLAASVEALGQVNQESPESAQVAPKATLDAMPQARPLTTSGAILPVVMDARIGEHPDRTRFVVEVSDPFRVRVFTLTNPDRVVVDMPEVLWRLNGPPRPSGQGLVRSYRYGLYRAGNSRFVIDLSGAARVAEPMILLPEAGHGYRLVMDLFPTDEASFARTSGWPSDLAEKYANAIVAPEATDAPVAAPNASIARTAGTRTKHVVVVDAGHGGIDSGTTGVDGALEKDLVLDEALRLRNALARRGYIVHLTRDTDVYIPLRERVNIARGYDADLFISLHADSNPDSSVSGASVYTLSESGSDKEAAALARKENQSDVIAGVDLSGQTSPVASILIDLAQRDTMNRSGRFAEATVAALSRTTDILPREPHRAAAFVVLKAPDVPAVLIELGYLSNARDCAQVRTNGWRDSIASAIADAVDGHFRASGAPSSVVTKQAAE
jgi:N-acetylmuramoyl-L-alanine amidase